MQALLEGSEQACEETGAPIRIRGARIEGCLRPFRPARSGEARTVLRFIDCAFDSPVDFSAVEFLSLGFIDCELPAFIGTNLETRADLEFSGCRFAGVGAHETELGEVEACSLYLSNARIGGSLRLDASPRRRFVARGTVWLDGARITGNVRMNGASLDGIGAPCLSARSAVIGGNLDLVMSDADDRFEAQGEICLVAAHITGDLSLDSARLYNPQGRALHCEDLRVESVFLAARGLDDPPFEASGRLNFLSATIGGSFFFSNARLAPGPDYAGLLAKGGPVQLNMRQARISNALIFNNIGALSAESGSPSRNSVPQPVRGWFMLAGVQAMTLADGSTTGWPAQGFLEIDGARYERIQYTGNTDVVATRLRWLRLQFPESGPGPASFRPQPFEQLSAVLRAGGLAREADEIAVEKIRARLAARVDNPLARIFPRLLMWVSHYGYSTRRSVAALLLAILLGASLYGTAIWRFDQGFVPVQEDPVPTVYTLVLDNIRKPVAQGCPGLDVLHYALDIVLPFIDLGQDSHCRFVPQGPARPLWLLLHSFYVITGNALSAVVVLTLTGVMRRE